jgi:hypothetical protein
MSEHENIMYRILGKVSDTDAPIVFKGALITKLILAENGFTSLSRRTVDIDANWVGEAPTMNDLVSAINKSLADFNGKLYAEATRNYGDKRSACIAIVDTETENRIITMDIDVKRAVGERIYFNGEIAVRGVLANEILADKISVLSGKVIFRRAKDLLDVFALAH